MVVKEEKCMKENRGMDEVDEGRIAEGRDRDRKVRK